MHTWRPRVKSLAATSKDSWPMQPVARSLRCHTSLESPSALPGGKCSDRQLYYVLYAMRISNAQKVGQCHFVNGNSSDDPEEED